MAASLQSSALSGTPHLQEVGFTHPTEPIQALFASNFNFGLAAAHALNAALLQQQAQAGIPQAHASIAGAQPKFAESRSLAKGETRSRELLGGDFWR